MLQAKFELPLLLEKAFRGARLAIPILCNELPKHVRNFAPARHFGCNVVFNGCHLESLTQLPRKSDRSSGEVGECCY